MHRGRGLLLRSSVLHRRSGEELCTVGVSTGARRLSATRSFSTLRRHSVGVSVGARSLRQAAGRQMTSLKPAVGFEGFLDQKAAQEFDLDLMGADYGFTLEQLMELAGLSVAAAVQDTYRPESRVLVVCGPGNNGGDGLVAARHLEHFGFKTTIYYPKRSAREPFYGKLVTQCEKLSIPFVEGFPEDKPSSWLEENFDVVVDAIFGFSFSGGPMRAPFDTVVASLKEASVPITSVDIPSGWDVELGNSGEGLDPEVLVSLTAPKTCAKGFRGIHYIGGRFVPPALLKKYGLRLPKYPGSEQIVRVSEV